MSYNKIVLIGNIGKDPETKDGANFKVSRFSLATSETRAKKGTGEKETKTQWHTITTWGNLAGIVEKWARKGQTVLVDGRLEYSSYTDNDGNKKYSTEIIAENFRILSKKDAAQGTTPGAATTTGKKDEKGEDLPF